MVLTPLVVTASLTKFVVAQAPTASTLPTLTQRAYGYIPSEVAAGIFGSIFAISCAALFFRVFTNRARWALCLPIGAFFTFIGFFVRIGLATNQGSLGLFLIQDLFILLSPTAFLAFNYILYGRFIVNCVPRGHSLIKPERTAKIFVISDITTFLIQGGGGGLLSSSNPNTVNLGANVILAGLVAQALSFAIYMMLVFYAYSSLKKHGMKPFEAPWGMVLKLLFFTSAFFMLRCIYRTVEYGQGRGHGYLMTHEVFFYVLDALPLFIGITTYACFWPSEYMESPVHTPVGGAGPNSMSLMPHGYYRPEDEESV